MQYKRTKGNEIEGILDIFVGRDRSGDEEDVESGYEILIHGDSKGLKSLARLLIEIAELDQEAVDDGHLPIGAREHCQLDPGFELSNSSDAVTVGRLDAKGTGTFYKRYVPKDSSVR